MNFYSFGVLLLVAGSLGACSAGLTAAATPCHQDAVQTSPGVILPLASGQTYQVYPTDNHISMTWLPTDALIVCPIGGSAVEITNIAERNEKIRAVRVFDLGLRLRQH